MSWSEIFLTQFNDPACSAISGLIVGEWFALRFLTGVLVAYFTYKALKRLIFGYKNRKQLGFEVEK